MPLDLPTVVRFARVVNALANGDATEARRHFSVVLPGIVEWELEIYRDSRMSYIAGKWENRIVLCMEGVKRGGPLVAAAVLSLEIRDIGNGIRVNSSIWAAGSGARDCFERMWNGRFGAPTGVILVGHSGGGANCLAWAAELSANNYNGTFGREDAVQVITFGSPKPGTEGLVTLASVYPQQNYRNGEDPVTELPPGPGFLEATATIAGVSAVTSPAGGLLAAAALGQWSRYAQVPRIHIGAQPRFFETSVYDHSMERYLATLEAMQLDAAGGAMVALQPTQLAAAAFAPILQGSARLAPTAASAFTGVSAMTPEQRAAILTIIDAQEQNALGQQVPFLDATNRLFISNAASQLRSLANSATSVADFISRAGTLTPTFTRADIRLPRINPDWFGYVVNGVIRTVQQTVVAPNNTAGDFELDEAALQRARAFEIPYADAVRLPQLNEAGFQAERARLQAQISGLRSEVARLESELSHLRLRMMQSQPAAPGYAPAVPAATPNAVPAPSNAAPGFPPAAPTYAPIDPRNPYRRY